MKLKSYYEDNKIKIIIGIIVAIILTIIIGCIFLPSIFYDNFIWKYFWGPIVSDVNGYTITYNGVIAEQKYTLISEITYGIIILLVIYGFYKLLKKWNVFVNWKFCLALFPYILTGSISRVLEDSDFFTEPLAYWFVTPLIYIQILIWVLLFFLLGYYLQKQYNIKYLTVNSTLFIGGILILLPFIFFTFQWFIGYQWSSSYGIRFDILFLISGLILLILTSVYLLSKFFKDKDSIIIYSEPLNLAMIAGHMIDGITSYISIYDPLNMGLPSYTELHPASDLLMQIWPPLFPIVKFLLIIFIIYLFDVIYKNELNEYQLLINLLKIGIFILGFAPGLRDLLRVVMGV